jgi:hypothetical protein
MRDSPPRLDCNLLGIDPTGVVHIADRLLREIDGPMLKTGLQGFHGAAIARPRRPENRPDPTRLETLSPASRLRTRLRPRLGTILEYGARVFKLRE